MAHVPSTEELAAERDALRQRLAEAEDVLRAIRGGEVDAVVVEGTRGAQIYTLEGADRVYRHLIESMSEGAVTLSPAGVVLYCNQQLARMLGVPLERVIGSLLRDYVVGDSRASLEATIAAAGAAPTRTEVDLKCAGGRVLPASLSAARLFGGEQEAIFCLVVTDISEQRQRLAEVAAAERLARSILRQTIEAIVVCDAAGKIERISDSARALCAMDPSGQAFGTAFPLTCEGGGAFDLGAALAGKPMRHVDVILASDGAQRHFILNAAPLVDGERLIGCVVGLTDVTERIDAVRQIRYLNRVYAMQSSINMLIVHAHDRDYLYHETSRIACEVGEFRAALVCDRDAVSGRLCAQACAPSGAALPEALRKLLARGDPAFAEATARAAAGGKVVVADHLDHSASPQLARLAAEHGLVAMAVLPFLVDGKCVGLAVFFAGDRAALAQPQELKALDEIARDIAFSLDHIEKEQRLNYLAYYDELTGLANRTLFFERVSQFVRMGGTAQEEVAVCAINLERFKQLNDNYGWQAGDDLLRQVAQWLQNETGDPNLLARFGGDAFAVVLPRAERGERAARFAERMTAVFPQHAFHIDGTPVRLGAKVGVAVSPGDGTDAETLFRHAEAALKQAKAGAARYLFFTQRMTEEIASKMTLENQLRNAYGHDEFDLYYQPKLDILTGKTDSAEALLRWRSPELGLVTPARFIGMLEESTMIHDIGRWVIRQVITDLAHWRATGLRPVRVAVNLSTVQLQHPRFMEYFKQDLGTQAVDGALEIEITESAIMAHPEDSITKLSAIRAMGVRIAIDDFGTGFSSLNYLLKLPADTLKIDRCFIVDMTEKPENLTLVSTIISLAHALKLRVVAEGVETVEQLNLLRLLRCDEIQGYYLSQPMPRDAFEKYFIGAARG
ncbi:sensor domain-containing protein [Massilia rhizosphaerae]|uniref:sensor domain-containing protein n=1 Tax=Massilia rhizosphaerae TaxID=2784389 RepID=UPI0018DC709D|nr:EAL domain-containing protein [Massilia rhizosphaerae]